MDEMHIYKYTVLIYSYLQHSIYSLCLIKNIADNFIVGLKINIIFLQWFPWKLFKTFFIFSSQYDIVQDNYNTGKNKCSHFYADKIKYFFLKHCVTVQANLFK